ncbi:MAG: zf-HC2 domain-containing protein [Anaerolineae bacterium]
MGFRLDHRFTQKNLSTYLDGQLTIRERERVERHLAECSRCQEELETLRSTVELLHAVPAIPLPRSFELPASVEKERERYRFWSRMHTALGTATAVVSLLLILFLSGDLAISQGFISLPGRTTKAPQDIQVEMAEVPQEEVHTPSPSPWEEKVTEKEAPAAAERATEEATPEGLEPEVEMLEGEPAPKASETPSASAAAMPETPTATPPRPPEPTATMVPPPPKDHFPAGSDQPSVWRIWKWLRTGWTALSGLLLVLVAGLLWTWQKRRLRRFTLPSDKIERER